MPADDELVKAFKLGVGISNEIHNTASEYPTRLGDYKGQYGRSGHQENRRKDALERQKSKRFNAANYARKLADGDLDEQDFEEASMETNESNNDIKADKVSAKKNKRFNPYKNQLMLSEWVVDPPSDLETHWLMVTCPVGKRVLVVSHRGHTSAYSKSGHLLNKFPSLLPGGSYKTLQNQSRASNYTLLDCVFDELNHTYWILDVMCLNGNPIYDSETDFRFFWLNTKLLEDYPGITEQSKVNPFKFKPLQSIHCNEDSIVNTLTDMHPFLVDGLLFYHRLGHYQPGRTPLVGWLKPYMLPEILGIPVPDSVMKTAPVEFNKSILKEANAQLQNTVSDRSFNNPRSQDIEKEHMET